jgi:hypothetical protein
MWEIFNFKVISATENSNKFQKTRFRKKKSVEDVVTLGPTTHATLLGNYIKIIATYFCGDHFIYCYYSRCPSMYYILRL